MSRDAFEPNLDEAARDRLNAARTATRERVETFDNKTLDPIRERQTATGPYDTPAEAVPRRIFNARPESVDAIQKYRAAVGKDTADRQIEEYAIDRLRTVATREDGTLDPRKLESFRRSHESALRALQAVGFTITSIRDVTPIPHNGVRPSKRRRV